MLKFQLKLLYIKMFYTKEKYFKNIERIKIKHYEHLSKFPQYSEDISLNVDNTFMSKTIIEKNELLKQLYKVDDIAGDGNTFEKSLNVMQWLTNNTMYCGMQTTPLVDNTKVILEFATNNNFKHAINCRLKAIALADLLSSINIIALPLCLLGLYEHKKSVLSACHFMVHIYLPETNKWVVFDPSFNVHFVDANNKVLNIIELREHLSQDDFPSLRGYDFNGDKTRGIEQYKSCFVVSCLEFILTWKNNERNIDKKCKAFGIDFNYLLEPNNDSLADWHRKQSTSNSMKKIIDSYVYIGTKQLLDCKE